MDIVLDIRELINGSYDGCDPHHVTQNRTASVVPGEVVERGLERRPSVSVKPYRARGGMRSQDRVGFDAVCAVALIVDGGGSIRGPSGNDDCIGCEQFFVSGDVMPHL